MLTSSRRRWPHAAQLADVLAAEVEGLVFGQDDVAVGLHVLGGVGAFDVGAHDGVAHGNSAFEGEDVLVGVGHAIDDEVALLAGKVVGAPEEGAVLGGLAGDVHGAWDVERSVLQAHQAVLLFDEVLLGDDLDAAVHLVLDIDLTELILYLGQVVGQRLDCLGVHADDDLMVGVWVAFEGDDGLLAVGGVDIDDGDIGHDADDLRGEVLGGEVTHTEVFVAIGSALHGEFEDGVEGIVEGGLAQGFFHDEVEVVGRAGGIGLESSFETVLAAAQ